MGECYKPGLAGSSKSWGLELLLLAGGLGSFLVLAVGEGEREMLIWGKSIAESFFAGDLLLDFAGDFLLKELKLALKRTSGIHIMSTIKNVKHALVAFHQFDCHSNHTF